MADEIFSGITTSKEEVEKCRDSAVELAATILRKCAKEKNVIFRQEFQRIATSLNSLGISLETVRQIIEENEKDEEE